ncbi:hypothetical protein DFR49_2534 [Hephaestia caeni]|uniref:Benenodin family lasso peptide n=1 Tax=Hephaestia caeni TaxID=645617 RepID=A0A397P7I5_9SPHN|nr:hypothetical protein [Hephaestia caeni]RIA44293.1 hypothetical protein DFR49_2534 [Hephaestia caeni]
MDRIDIEDIVELGEATSLTRGGEPSGVLDTDGIMFAKHTGLSEDD